MVEIISQEAVDAAPEASRAILQKARDDQLALINEREEAKKRAEDNQKRLDDMERRLQEMQASADADPQNLMTQLHLGLKETLSSVVAFKSETEKGILPKGIRAKIVDADEEDPAAVASLIETMTDLDPFPIPKVLTAKYHSQGYDIPLYYLSDVPLQLAKDPTSDMYKLFADKAKTLPYDQDASLVHTQRQRAQTRYVTLISALEYVTDPTARRLTIERWSVHFADVEARIGAAHGASAKLAPALYSILIRQMFASTTTPMDPGTFKSDIFKAVVDDLAARQNDEAAAQISALQGQIASLSSALSSKTSYSSSAQPSSSGKTPRQRAPQDREHQPYPKSSPQSIKLEENSFRSSASPAPPGPDRRKGSRSFLCFSCGKVHAGHGWKSCPNKLLINNFNGTWKVSTSLLFPFSFFSCHPPLPPIARREASPRPVPSLRASRGEGHTQAFPSL